MTRVIYPAPLPDMAVILGDLALILVLARAVGWLFSRLGQPAVIGEILAGILLGPSLLGPVSGWLFPIHQRAYLVVLANLGLVLFMFIVGLELDIGLVRGRERVAGSVSVLSIALPLALGIGLAVYLPRASTSDFWPFALFVGAAMSVTAFPVLARILTDRNMHRTETGALALACAAVDDVLAWTLLAVVIAISRTEGNATGRPAWLVIFAVPFALFLVLLVRPRLERLTGAYERAGRLTPGILAVVLVGLLVSAGMTDLLGIHFIFGAFLFGAVMPRVAAAKLRHDILVRLEQISVLLLLPVFFLISGLQVDLRGLTGERLVQLLLILVVAISGKFIGAYTGARLRGVRPWQARSLGILMNTRGLTELIILNVGHSPKVHLIGDDLFTMMVVMAVVTTMMTGPLLRRAYPDRRVARDVAEAERAALGLEPARFRVLVVATDPETTARRFDIATDIIADERPAEIILSSIQPFGPARLEVGSGLSDELAAMTNSMTSLEQLVQRGTDERLTVNVLTRFSSDVSGDFLAQVDAMHPDIVLIGADDVVASAVTAENSARVVIVQGASTASLNPSRVHVTWGGSPDDDAALVIAIRVATFHGVPLAVESAGHASQRRLAALVDRLSQRGVVMAVPDGGAARQLRLGAVPQGDVDLAVKAEPDPEPVDWTNVRIASQRGVPTSTERA